MERWDRFYREKRDARERVPWALGYLVFDYFITDESGDATFSFEANSSYHMLWAKAMPPLMGDPIRFLVYSPAWSSELIKPTRALDSTGEKLGKLSVFSEPRKSACSMINLS